MEKKILNTSRVAILLATYNSERFLEELFQSLLNQTDNNWSIYIIDDMSTDRTYEILEKYTSQFPFFILLKNDRGRQGAKTNFLYLLQRIESEYYLFCDHDDIWLPNKIELTIAELETLRRQFPNRPLLVHSDLIVVDDKLKKIDNSFFHFAGCYPSILLTSIKHLAHSNCVTGCTMGFNALAKKVSFPVSNAALMHDSWIALRVLNEGGIIKCINIPLILYRQHQSNTLGATRFGGINLTRKIMYFKTFILGNYRQYKMAKEATGISGLEFIKFRISYLIKRKKI